MSSTSPVKRLFIVVNPTQYLNAVEYVHQTGPEEDCVVAITPYFKGIEELNKMGANKVWVKTYFHEIEDMKAYGNDKEYWRLFRNFIQVAFEDFQPSQLIAGNLIDTTTYPFYLKNKKRFKKVVILDDGTPTLNLVKRRKHGGFFRSYHVRSFKFILKNLLYHRLFTPGISPPKSLEFFTIFKVDGGPNDTVRTNKYVWLASKVQKQEITNQVLFIGSNLIDRGVVKQAPYLKSLERIATDINALGHEFVYGHHRGESEPVRSEIRKICKTVDFNQPLEVCFLNAPRPAFFVGHFSSALFNLSRIYSLKNVRAYLFPEKDLIGSVDEPKEYLSMVQSALKADPIIESYQL